MKPLLCFTQLMVANCGRKRSGIQGTEEKLDHTCHRNHLSRSFGFVAYLICIAERKSQLAYHLLLKLWCVSLKMNDRLLLCVTVELNLRFTKTS